MVAASAAVCPAPVFEGSEKRLEVEFGPGDGSRPGGLRALSRADLDYLTATAACCIVSARHNAAFDAYVLSESSLFVFPDKLVLKTCGTTKLLAAVAPLLQLAAGLGMASFLFPEQQVCFAVPFVSLLLGTCHCHVVSSTFGRVCLQLLLER
jgi:hypothetical protein